VIGIHHDVYVYIIFVQSAFFLVLTYLLTYFLQYEILGPLVCCLIYAWTLPAHPRRSFECVLLLNQLYLTTMYHLTIPLQFI